MKPTSQTLLRYAPWAAAALVLIVAFAYALLAPAGPDDFCRGAWHGAWDGLVRQNYQHWSGRWASVATHGLMLPHIGLDTWRYNAALCLYLVIVALIWLTLLTVLLGKDVSLKNKAAMALGLTALYWAGSPSPGEQLYWWHGGVEQLLPILAAMLCIRALAPFKDEPKPSLVIVASRTLAAAALAILAGGFHELVGLILFGVLVVLAVAAAGAGRRIHTAQFAVAALAAAVGLALNLTAPGWVTRRALDMSGGGNIIYALRMSFLDPDESPSRWLLDIRLLALTSALLTGGWFASVAPRWLSVSPFGLRDPAKKAAAIAAITLAAVFLATLATTYGQGFRTAGRTQDMIYAAFFAGWLVALTALAPLAKPQPALNAIALAVLALSLVTAPNTLQGLFDLKPVISDWRPAVRQRDRDMRAAVAAGSTDIVVPYISARSKLYFWEPLSTDPTNWRNDCYARYYGAHTVRSQPPPAIAPTPAT